VAEIDRVRVEVALGNRILANEGVLDAFGHVSIRNPENPNRYFLSRSRSPELVEPGDVLEYDLDSNPVKPTDLKLYAERVIHGEIYKARPDVMAVTHHHAPAVMPFCITWEYWSTRLEKSGNGIPGASRGKKAVPAKRKRASVAKAKTKKTKGRKR